VHTDDRGFDAQVDVLRHQRDSGILELSLQRKRLTEDRVVRAVTRKCVRQSAIQDLRLEEQAAGRLLLAAVHVLRRRQLETLVDLRFGRIRHQLVEKAADLSHVARGFGQAFLSGVELLEHDHRDEDVVLFEAKDRRRIVH
jgi:hypothetical protein